MPRKKKANKTPEKAAKLKAGATQAAIAAELDISTRVLREYFAAGCPRGSIDEIKAWREREKEPRAGLSPRSKWRTRNEREENRRRKRENDVAEKLLVPRADVIEAVTAMLIKFKTRIEALPDELQMLFPAEVRVLVKRDFADALRQALKEMSEWQI